MQIDTIVNNKPFFHIPENGEPELSVGGVTTALYSLASNYAIVVSDGYGSDIEKFPDNETYQVKVNIGPMQRKGHYLIMSNGILWPLHHAMLDKVDDYRNYWNKMYESVQKAVAKKTHELAKGNIFVNDYQMLGVGEELDNLRNEYTRGFFLHIPAINENTFRESRYLEKGNEIQNLIKRQTEQLTHYNFAGFQMPYDVENYASMADLLLKDSKIKPNDNGFEIEYDGRKTFVKSIPVGIDVDRVKNNVNEIGSFQFDDGLNLYDEITNDRKARRKIVAKVGRLDYTKNFPGDMRDFFEFAKMRARENEFFRGYFVAAPTREKLSAYDFEKNESIRTAEKINSEWRENFGYDLIVFENQDLPWKTTINLMAEADIYWDRSLKDGKHLTPEEATVALHEKMRQTGKQGIVVCGEDAGTGQELISAGLEKDHGILVAPDSQTARRVNELWESNSRIDEEIFEFRKSHDIRNYEDELIKSFEEIHR